LKQETRIAMLFALTRANGLHDTLRMT
jgi:hypothetical protein